ncbi:abortive infection family protein [Longispora albida]|uniref:abortive infection family protein n=1 Tax=Longispora albida TaxID=203523 RepID=UPI0012FBF46F|nr:abortive infection family protein [Longispora albida]
MRADDLFEPNDFAGAWGQQQEQLKVDLLERLRRAPDPAHSDLEVSEALVVLLHREFMAYGTDGGQRLDDHNMRLAVRATLAVCARIGVSVKLPWHDFTSFRSYWIAHDGHGSWAARRQMVGEAFDSALARILFLQERADTGTVVTPALSALDDPTVINDHLKRLLANVDADPRLAVSVAKDLVESTAKLVLRERGMPYNSKADLPTLVAQAQQALNLHAAGVTEATDEAKALKTILGSLARLTQGVTELRNQVGIGHGRESVPAWIRPRHARLAAGAATTWCNLMLETLGDPDAPWRATRSPAATPPT